MKRKLRRLVCRFRRHHRWQPKQFMAADVARSTAHHVVGVSAPVCECGAIDVDRIRFLERERRVERRDVPRSRKRRRPGR